MDPSKIFSPYLEKLQPEKGILEFTYDFTRGPRGNHHHIVNRKRDILVFLILVTPVLIHYVTCKLFVTEPVYNTFVKIFIHAMFWIRVGCIFFQPDHGDRYASGRFLTYWFPLQECKHSHKPHINMSRRGCHGYRLNVFGIRCSYISLKMWDPCQSLWEKY